MWKPQHRAAADRRGLRYKSDLTDAEWVLVAPLIRPAERGGRPRAAERSEVLQRDHLCALDGVRVEGAAEGPAAAQRRLGVPRPVGLGRTLERIHHALYVEVRENAGREASPTTAIIDSQTAKGAVKGGLRSTRPAMTLARRCLAASATHSTFRQRC